MRRLWLSATMVLLIGLYLVYNLSLDFRCDLEAAPSLFGFGTEAERTGLTTFVLRTTSTHNDTTLRCACEVSSVSSAGADQFLTASNLYAALAFSEIFASAGDYKSATDILVGPTRAALNKIHQNRVCLNFWCGFFLEDFRESLQPTQAYSDFEKPYRWMRMTAEDEYDILSTRWNRWYNRLESCTCDQ